MIPRICCLSEKWVAGVVALQKDCFPHPFPPELLWQESHLVRHIEIFPEGQFVAVLDGKVVGSSSSMRVTRQEWLKPHSWDELTGGLYMTAHDPSGHVLYGVDISVHPSFRGKGIARLLYQARFDLVREKGLDGFATICRLPDYRDSGVGNLAAYVSEVSSGLRTDRTMTPLIKMGLTCTGVAYDCMEDEESGNSGARLVWRP